jgi:hypothetical protein
MKGSASAPVVVTTAPLGAPVNDAAVSDVLDDFTTEEKWRGALFQPAEMPVLVGMFSSGTILRRDADLDTEAPTARVRHVRVLVVRWASGRRALRSWF